MSENEKYPAQIPGRQINLPNGRAVWAGEYDDSWYIKFTNGEVETRMRLSYPAAAALMTLLGDGVTSPSSDEMQRFIIEFSREGENLEWKCVPKDDGEASTVSGDRSADDASSVVR